MTDCVVFDFANTLGALSPKREEIVKSFLNSWGLPVPPFKNIYEAFLATDEALPYSSLKILNDCNKSEFYERYNLLLFKFLGVPSSFPRKPDNFYNLFYSFYHSVRPHWTVSKESISLLRFLNESKIRVGIASNFDSNLVSYLKKINVEKYIDFLVVSAIIDKEKPGKDFYQYIIDKHGVNPDSTIYVGDSYSLDYEPSFNLGFKSVLYDPYDSFDDSIITCKTLADIPL
tara:strand:- start:12908 stop:13597 length:690 start_codon:yes stop_codon:yes gene_type:complete